MTGSDSHITLFNDERYQRRNLRPGECLFRCDHRAGGRLVGTLSGVVAGTLLDCGHSAPFGGIDCVNAEEDAGAIGDVFRAALTEARAEGVRDIRVRARPGYFGANDGAAAFALLNLGATVEACELSLGLEIWRFETAERYAAALNHSARNQLRQGLDAGFAFATARSADEWARCYDLLAETRRRRGASLKIALPYVIALRDIFGDRIAMHQLLHRDRLAAAALVYRVAPAWDYVVAWGDDLALRGKRAMNTLAYHLVAGAIAAGMRVVDLGISSVGGIADDGLVHFKRGIGAATGLRIDFRLPVQ